MASKRSKIDPFLVHDESIEGPLQESDEDIDMPNTSHNNAWNRNRNHQNRSRMNDNKNDNNSESVSPNTKKKRNYNKKKKETLTDDQKMEMQEKVKMKVAKTVHELIQHNLTEWNQENVEENDEDSKLKASKEFIFGLTELVYDTAVVIGNDLDSFKKHRGKKTVLIDDFMLFLRRNKDMKKEMCEYLTQIQMNNFE